MESRVIELEVRYTHLAQQYAELSAVVFEQHKAIQELQQKLLGLRRQMDDLGDPVANDKPPHY